MSETSIWGYIPFGVPWGECDTMGKNLYGVELVAFDGSPDE